MGTACINGAAFDSGLWSWWRVRRSGIDDHRISARIPTRILGSLPQTAASVGIMLATGIFALCNHFLTSEQFLSGMAHSVLAFCGDVDRWAVYPPAYRRNAGFSKAKTTNNKEKSVPPLIELFKNIHEIFYWHWVRGWRKVSPLILLTPLVLSIFPAN